MGATDIMNAIEDSLWNDPRFIRLCIKMGDEFRAAGAVLVAWRVAQRFWCPGKNPIPGAAFKEAELPEILIEVGLADREAGGIRMRGSEEHFAQWFISQKSGRIGGLKSAELRREKAQGPLDAPSTNPQGPLDQPSSELEKPVRSLTILPSVFTAEWVRDRIPRTRRAEIEKLYDDLSWLEGEMRKMAIWLDANRKKIPKSDRGWNQFIMGWLSRGWDRHRLTLPSQPPKPPKFDHDALWIAK